MAAISSLVSAKSKTSRWSAIRSGRTDVRRSRVDHSVAGAQGLLDGRLRHLGRRLEHAEAECGQVDVVIEANERLLPAHVVHGAVPDESRNDARHSGASNSGAKKALECAILAPAIS